MDKRYDIPKAQTQWAYFLDLDGTLIELAPTPDAIRVERPVLELLRNLYQATGGALALVSGRSLVDLESRLDALPLPCAGQHGLERRDAQGKLHLYATPTRAKDMIRLALAPVLARHRGLLLEDKGLSLALHYRQAPRQAAHVHGIMNRLLEMSGPGLQIQKGKFVVEIKPAGVNKGSAIAEFLSEVPFHGRLPVFIGDDQTDEYGFEIVNRYGGMSIKIGKGKTLARYRLPHIQAVHAWLSQSLREAP